MSLIAELMRMMKYPSRFLQAIGHTLRLEGGYSNDESDLGSVTHYGISSANHPEAAEAIAKGTFTEAMAQEIYYKRYWSTIQHVNLIPGPVAFVLFDAKVHGNMRAYVRRLQAVLNTIDGNSLKVDGLYGPKTAAATLNMSERAVSAFLTVVDLDSPTLARDIARKVMLKQAAKGLPVKDYTAGFENRFRARAEIAEEIA